jgi:hypothetical protein
MVTCFSPFCRRALFWDSSRREWPLARETSLHRDPFGEHGGGFLTRTLKERELLETGVSIGTPLGNLGRGYIYKELWVIVKEGSWNGTSLFLGVLRGIQDMRRRAQGTGISHLEGPVRELGRLLVCQDLRQLWRQHLSPWVPRRPQGSQRDCWKGAWGGSIYGCSVTGTWSGGSLIGDPEGYVEKCFSTFVRPPRPGKFFF